LTKAVAETEILATTATAAIDDLERGFISAVGPAYLANAKVPRADRIHAWRYKSFMPLLHRLHGAVTGLRSCHRVVNGNRIVWLQGGNPAGEPVLLLHGFGASKENWLPLLPFLARRYHLFILDLPGWGESRFHADARYGMDDQVARVAAWATVALPASAHIVGSSMGGGIAGLLAARHPELARSVTLMNAAGVAGTQTTVFEQQLMRGHNGLIAHNIKGVLDLLTTVMESRVLALMLAPGMYWDLVSRRDVNEHMFRHLLQYEPASELPAFSAITVPAFILWGEEDQVLHVSCSDTFKALIPHAQVKRLSGVGHLPMVESPRASARLLRRFWRNIREGNAAAS
jgi:pimeloyl-ACP methyl ester carboxylesterase